MTSLIIFAVGVAVGAIGYRNRAALSTGLHRLIARARR